MKERKRGPFFMKHCVNLCIRWNLVIVYYPWFTLLLPAAGCWHTRVIPKVSGLDILHNDIFHDLYISEMCIFYWLIWVCCRYDVVFIYEN